MIQTIYIFDGMSFAMGLTATAKAMTGAGYYGRCALLQPGNREWVTSIECVGACGFSLPPVVTFEGKFLSKRSEKLPNDWQFGLY